MDLPDNPVSPAEVKTLLEQRRHEWSAIAKSANVSESWIAKFVRGKIDNPGYLTLSNVRAAISSLPPAQTEQAEQGAC